MTDAISIIRAVKFASDAHGKQKYDDMPYIAHPLTVALLVAAEGGTEDQILAAILHDVVEDTDVTVSRIAEEFGEDVAEMVRSLSKPEGMERADYIDQILPSAKLVKLSDSRVNYLGLINSRMKPERKEKLSSRYLANIAQLTRKETHVQL